MKMSYSAAGLMLTERKEGLRLIAYQDSVGVWTIGYGHTGRDVVAGMTITQAQAQALLLADLAHAVNCVNDCVKVTLTQNQFDALVDFTFNLGATAFMTSTLLKLINAGDLHAAAAEFQKWDKAGGKVLPGLLERREEEEGLYLQAAAGDTGTLAQLVLTAVQWARLAHTVGFFRKGQAHAD